jgi:hypothetical protein
VTLTEVNDGVVEQAVQWLATLPMLREPERWSFAQADDGFAVLDDTARRPVCVVSVEERDMDPLGMVPVVRVRFPHEGFNATLSGKSAARGDLYSLLTRKLTPLLVPV